MGACSFMVVGYGKTMREAYHNLVEEYEIEYGTNSYNGTISTTCGYRENYCHLGNGENWTKTKEKKAYEIADKRIDILQKRECECIDLGKVSNRITHHNGWHKFLFYGWAAE